MRISSDSDDGTYTTGARHRIFLEFNKPVRWAYPNTQGINPKLILNTSGGAAAEAEYQRSDNPNSRQYFLYTVANGQNTDHLNVTGISFNGVVYNATGPDSSYTAPDYPFAWSRGAADEYEEVRLTRQTGKDGKTPEGTSPRYYVRTLPVNTTLGNTDYQLTLYAAKDIKIDTTPPSIVSIERNTNPGWYSSGDIYFTVTFNEPVKLVAGTTPRISMHIGSTTNNQTSASASDVRVNGDKITFRYIIQGTDTSNGNDIYVEAANITGNTSIQDIAGNALPANPFGSGSPVQTQTARTLTGIKIETQKPGTPRVRVLTASNTGSVFSQNVSNSTRTGDSNNASATTRDLTNVYSNNLWLAIEGTGDAYKYAAIEYTIDGANWLRANNTNTPFELNNTRTGQYAIRARQIDSAGNITDSSNYSPEIRFNWDPGPLITRISSTNANGTYTHNPGRNTIELIIEFRKTLSFGGSSMITLNALNNSDQAITVGPPTTASGTQILFTYNVLDGHKTPTSPTKQFLKITNISGTDIWDGASVGNGVNVSSLVISQFGTVPFDSSKEITVETGALTVSTPVFIADNQGGTGWNTETNANFHGIRSDDGSYWTTLQIPFNHNISKGSGEITITQSSDGYRLPAVITEAQYNRLKNKIGTTTDSETIDTYYVKGTNGYIYNSTTPANSASDTSAKYILQYQYEPRSGVTNGTPFTENTAVKTSFFNAFRNAEAVKIDINAQDVTINGSTLIIRLSGSSALQVPGATYVVNLSSNAIVTDALSNTISNFPFTTNNTATLSGCAKPFVRIKKTQDTISVNNSPSISQPRLVAAQPLLANARMDCRTPDSTIYYTATTGQTSVLVGFTLGTNGNQNNWNYTSGPTDSATPDATRPTSSNANTYSENTAQKQITIGYTTGTTSPTISNVQGFQWWVRARASAGGSNSYETEEMALRTVISYLVRGGHSGTSAVTGVTEGGSRSQFGNGDQAWIRGGDAISSSTVPGFPFTWEDNWSDSAAALKNKRAGIRLMTLVGCYNNTSMNNSLWRFVTWDMNATAYIDFIRGRDVQETVNSVTWNASNAETAWQYGPKRWCYQTGGWTPYKEQFRVFAGKHRVCDMGYQYNPPHQDLNYSGTLMARPTLTASNSTFSQGLNQK